MLWIKRNASTILTCVSAVGVVATTIMAVKATPKAVQLLEKAKKEKDDELTNLEVIKTVAPVYIPTVLTGAATVACIFGANILNKRNQAALMSAYGLLDATYKDYKNKVKEVYGEEADSKVNEEIAKDKYDGTVVTEEGNVLFYDEFSKRYFESTLYKVQEAEYRLNRDLIMRDYAYLNEFYEYLGIGEYDDWKLGWSTGGCMAAYWQPWIDFTHPRFTLKDGTECIRIVMFHEPFVDFEDYA